MREIIWPHLTAPAHAGLFYYAEETRPSVYEFGIDAGTDESGGLVCEKRDVLSECV